MLRGKNRFFIMTEEKKAYFILSIIKEQFMMSIGISNTLLSNVANRKKRTGT